MNLLLGAMGMAATKLVKSSHLQHKYPPFLIPIPILEHTSLYSSTATPSQHQKSTRNRKTQTPPPPPPSPPISSEIAQTKLVDWPRPTQIPYQPKVANTVSLIGHVQIPVQIQASPDDKYFAGTVIAQQHAHSSDSPPFFWIPVIFEGDLAHIAACHLKKNDIVHIAGQLTVDPPSFTFTEGQANVQVMVHSINYVEGFSPPKKSFAPPKLEELPVNRPTSTVNGVESSWRDLLKNSKQWSDNRENKLNGLVKPNYPDFKHKESGVGLWLDRAPQWVLPGLEGLEFDVPQIRMKQVNDKNGLDEDPWKKLVEKPHEWWDNRLNKFNARSPDFKHKDTGKGLWLSDSPAWVLSKLPPLKAEGIDATTSKGNILTPETI